MTIIKISDELKGKSLVLTDFQRFNNIACNISKTDYHTHDFNSPKELIDFLKGVIAFYEV